MLSVLMIPLLAALVSVPLGLAFGLIAVLGTLYAVWSFIGVRRTRYFITNTRVIEAHGRNISKEISLECFSGKTQDECMKIAVDHESGAYTYYKIHVYDLETEKIITLKTMSEDDMEKIKKIILPEAS
jgi:hypothetical protein